MAVSDRVKSGPEKAPHRSLWKALGLTDAELKLPLPARPVPIEATVEFRSSADRTPTALQHQLRRELYLLTRKTPLSD